MTERGARADQRGIGVGFSNGVMEDPGVVSAAGGIAGAVARPRGVGAGDLVPEVLAPGVRTAAAPAGCFFSQAWQAVSV